MVKAISNNLKHARIKAGYFQKDVAIGTGITENTYAIIERGTRPTTGKTANSICEFLKVKFDDCFKIVD